MNTTVSVPLNFSMKLRGGHQKRLRDSTVGVRRNGNEQMWLKLMQIASKVQINIRNSAKLLGIVEASFELFIVYIETIADNFREILHEGEPEALDHNCSFKADGCDHGLDRNPDLRSQVMRPGQRSEQANQRTNLSPLSNQMRGYRRQNLMISGQGSNNNIKLKGLGAITSDQVRTRLDIYWYGWIILSIDQQ